MADFVLCTVILRYLPYITEYVKAAKQHAFRFGWSTCVTILKSPRMRVNEEQLDHFVTFITSPKCVTSYKTFLLVRTRCWHTRFWADSGAIYAILRGSRVYPLIISTIIRIFSSRSTTVRQSLYGLDYIVARSWAPKKQSGEDREAPKFDIRRISN